MPESEARIPFGAILEAKLVLTDRLIAEDLKAKKPAASASPGRSDKPRNQEKV